MNSLTIKKLCILHKFEPLFCSGELNHLRPCKIFLKKRSSKHILLIMIFCVKKQNHTTVCVKRLVGRELAHTLYQSIQVSWDILFWNKNEYLIPSYPLPQHLHLIKPSGDVPKYRYSWLKTKYTVWSLHFNAIFILIEIKLPSLWFTKCTICCWGHKLYWSFPYTCNHFWNIVFFTFCKS